VALAGVTLVAPRGLSSELGGQVDADLDGQPERNRVIWIDTDGLDEALRLSPVPLSTMGRGLDEDRAYFLAAAAAGRYAALRVPVEEDAIGEEPGDGGDIDEEIDQQIDGEPGTGTDGDGNR
jgi:hypothetical protein